MPRSGSLPWLFIAAVLSTLFAVYVEASFIHPWVSAMTGTSLWQTNQLSYAYEGRRMIADFARSLLIIFVLGIWFGVLIDARKAM